jgi:hypothetical protein
MNKIFDLIPKLIHSGYRIILVQIQEAHSKYWPQGMDNHPDIHRTLEDRISRAQEFNNKLIEHGIDLLDTNVKKALRVLVDPWGDEFEKLYQCWPDQYYILSVDHTILKKSEYTMDAVIEEDYADYLISELTVI